MIYKITDCRRFGSRQLCAAMNAAFSDYVVPMNLSKAQFEDFQRQRGYVAAQSFVALAREEIAAFWLSGLPDPAYSNRAYTLSVGTHPAHRRKGLSRKLLTAVLEAQRGTGATGLQLEVLSGNRAAIGTYEALGFGRHRILRVLKLAKAPAEQSGPHTAEPLSLADLPANDDAYFDTAPTPQNSRTALHALSPDVYLLGVRTAGALQGWGAVYPDGAVAQIAVHRQARGQGIGGTLLCALWQAASQDALTFVNVDASAKDLNAFLEKAGAEELLLQYDMRLDLG